jgi:predicted nucleic acid-binding protein
MLEFENKQNPYKERRNAIFDWKIVAAAHCVETEDVVALAERLTALGVKVKDALHISCAIHSKADYFVTTDKKLLNTAIAEIKVVNPLTLINELEG